MTLRTLINVDVPDLASGIRFYCDGLGLALRRTLFDATVAEMSGAPCPMFLIARAEGTAAYPQPAQQRSFRRHWTPVHLDFVVDDLDFAIAKAQRAGATPEGVTQNFDWGALASLSDPFGHGFCFVKLTDAGYDSVAEAPKR